MFSILENGEVDKKYRWAEWVFVTVDVVDGVVVKDK